MTVLILGATGFVGLNLVDALVAAGESPRCGRRKRSNVIPLRARRATMVVADLDDPAVLTEAMRGVDTVVHCAGYYPRLSLEGDAAIEQGCAQLQNALDAAAAANVGRFVYVSTTATVAPVSGGPANEHSRYLAVPKIGTYHALKWQMEALAEAETRFEVTVACPAGCLGPWDLRVGTSALLVTTARGLQPLHPDGLVNLVDVRDVAEALVKLATMPAPPPRVLLCGGTYQLQPLLREMAGRYGVAPPSRPLSPQDAVEKADEAEQRAAEQGKRPELSREIVDLILHSTILDVSLAERELGAAWRPLEETLDAFDNWARRMRILPPAPRTETEHST